MSIEFGDYFRTQRWNQGPGCDQPGLGKDLIKAKVASLHRPSLPAAARLAGGLLRQRLGHDLGRSSSTRRSPTSRWATTCSSLHGMYYSTHGGWWEWAPPDNTFRMPYWKHLRRFHGLRPAPQLPAQPGPPPLRRGRSSIRSPPWRPAWTAAQAVEAAFAAGRATLRRRASTSTSWTSSRSRAPRSGTASCRSPARRTAC